VLDGGDGSFDAGDSLRFIGEPVDTLYTDTNLYVLGIGSGGARISSASPGLPAGPSAPFYIETRRYAPQNIYALTSPTGDPWFADKLLAYKSAAQKQISFSTDNYVANGSAPRLSVNLWGGNDLAADTQTEPDHHVIISANGQTVEDLRFDGIVEQEINAELASGGVGSSLSVTVRVPNDAGYIFDLVHLDSATLTYPRAFVADGAQLSFESNWPKYRMGGFASAAISVYVQQENGDVVSIADVLAGGNCSAQAPACEAMFGGVAGNNQYFATTDVGVYAASIAIPHAAGNIDVSARALVISHPDFIGLSDSALEQYVAQLSAEMGGAALIDVRDIYAQYNGGIVDAGAIAEYIKEAVGRGTEQVLLVGGDTYDYRKYLGEQSQSLIPSLYEQTSNVIRYSPVDPKYGDVDGDDVPDIVVGRLPIQTAEQLRNLLAKREAYMNRSYRGKAVFAADIRDDVEQYDYKHESDQAIASYFSDWQITRAYIDDLGATGAKQVVSSNINAGTSMMVYTGHSSNDQLSFYDLFSGEDAANLTNVGQPTVVTQWGCWNNYNVEPSEISMADQFLLKGQQGAVATIGASTLTDAAGEKILADLYYAELAKGKSIGVALRDAKRELAAINSDYKDLLLGVTLMGFPELRVN